MYLKSLKLAGFKSFADRTRLELEPGVTVVVGPNGSGKSNIVDAIGWVMGTQSPTAMRTQKMEDVIFAGTATRPPLGRAEVTLVFDNASRQLPLDLAEVAITRRLYRDGSSDYEINGVRCRLLDVQELLADSGVGRHQHVLVGQGQITSILTARPEDHRAVIEEAAGILKHRLRKERSIRRLERTESDVVRLEDILREMKRQIRPLKRQAQDAARHDEVRTELRALRLWLGGDQLRAIDMRLSEIVTDESSLGSRLQASEARLLQLEHGIGPLEQQVAAVGLRLDETSESAARLEATNERIKGTTRLALERLRGLRARLEGADERREDLVGEAADLREQLAAVIDDERRARTQAEQAEQNLVALEEQERSLAEQEALPTAGAAAMVRGDLRSLESAADRDRREAEQLEDRRARIEHRQEEAARALASLQEEEAATERAVKHWNSVLQEALQAEQSADAEWERAEQAGREADARVMSLSSRREAIEAVVAGGADPRARARAKESGGGLGSVTEVLDIPSSLASAVDAALGQWQDAVVFDREDSLTRAAGTLKAEGLGGLPLITGDAEAGISARDVARQWGGEALVDCLGPHANGPVAARLLGDVLVVESWATGWEIVHRHPTVRAVTPDGDLITVGGVRLVDPEGATPAMLEAAASSLELAEAERVEARTWERQAREARDIARHRRKAADGELRAVMHAREEARRSAESTRSRQADGTADLDRTTQRLALLEEAMLGRVERLVELRDRLSALEGEEAEQQRAWEEIAARRMEVGRLRDEARQLRQAREKDLGAVVERKAMLQHRLAEVERESSTLAQTSFDPDALDRLERVADFGRAAEGMVRGHIEALRVSQAELRRVLSEARNQLADERRQIGRLQEEVASIKERRSALSIEHAELSVRREGTCEALRRDADADEQLALAAPEPSRRDDTTHLARVAALEADLRRMGPINPLAGEEFRELDERRQFMEDQLADLEQSRGEIKKVIKALDDEVEHLFMEAYGQVAAAFEEHISIMFPGGRGSLVLTDPDNPLTTGVDIKVQPLGKRVTRLSLLSGGEKSMAALAFLFAVFRAEPSPFYVLDEVEAALDDANLRRFLNLVEAIEVSSQLIIVTHQQQTMEAADTLYGVTMEPGGSTKLIAKKMVASQFELS